jgi:hypothetical protein
MVALPQCRHGLNKLVYYGWGGKTAARLRKTAGRSPKETPEPDCGIEPDWADCSKIYSESGDITPDSG